MFLFLFIFALTATSTIAQDETSEDAFAMPADEELNEGMDGFVMSTAIMEPVMETTKSPAVTEHPAVPVPDEVMGEDPFAMDEKLMTTTTTAAPTTEIPVIPMETTEVPMIPVENTPKGTEEPKPVEETTKTDEEEISEPSTATVWTASTEVARETTERRVLKQKSGEEIKENEETTTETVTTGTPKASHEESEETPFDSHQLSGLFEADGSPKAEEGPAFPILQMPEEHSAEILGDKDSHTTTSSGTTTEGATTVVVTDAPTTEATTQTTMADVTEAPTTSVEEITSSTTSTTITTAAEEAITTFEEETTVTTTTEATTTATTTESMTTTTMMPVMREEPARRPPSVLTPITVKITSIEWMNDFGNNTSGKYKKLVEQIIPDMTQILKDVFEDEFVSFEVESLTKGSVVINGFVGTKSPIADVEQAASRFEATLASAGSKIGGNTVDSASVTVNGTPSRAYLDKVNASYTPASSSPLLIIAVVVVAVVLFVLIAVFICFASNRRSHGGAKLAMKIPEDAGRMNGVPQINLMSYAGSTVGSPSNRSTMMPRHEEREVV